MVEATFSSFQTDHQQMMLERSLVEMLVGLDNMGSVGLVAQVDLDVHHDLTDQLGLLLQ